VSCQFCTMRSVGGKWRKKAEGGDGLVSAGWLVRLLASYIGNNLKQPTAKGTPKKTKQSKLCVVWSTEPCSSAFIISQIGGEPGQQKRGKSDSRDT